MSGGMKELDERWTSQVTPELTEAVTEGALDGRVTCPVLRKIADEHGVPYAVAGAAADMAGIRVHNCELGCF